MIYSEQYLKTFKRFQDVVDTDCIITLSQLPSQTEAPIFKIKCIPQRKVFIENTNENNISSVMFLKRTLEESTSINSNNIKFPLNDLTNRIAKIRFNGITYTMDTKDYNMFGDIIRFNVSTSI
jgi:hypothetical protein